ncbi:hypothetical protein MMC30_004579 [Trapelia coarctata]|nr:hypothetical protein [Trapelia coarctata]
MRYRLLLSLALLSSPTLGLTIGPREVWESHLHQRGFSEDHLYQRDLTYLEVRDIYERLALPPEVIEAHLSKRGQTLTKVKKPKEPKPILPLASAGSGDLESANRRPIPRPGPSQPPPNLNRPSGQAPNLNRPSAGGQPAPNLSRPSGSGSNIAGPSGSQPRPPAPFRKVPSAPSLSRVSSGPLGLRPRPAAQPAAPPPPAGPRPPPPPPKLPPSNKKPKPALNIHGEPLKHKVTHTPATGVINNSALRQAKKKLTPPKSNEELIKATTAAKIAAGPKPASNGGAAGSGSRKSDKDKKKGKAGVAAYMPTMGQLGALGAVAAVGMQGWGNVVTQNGLTAAQQGLQVSQQGLLASQQGLTANVKNQHIAFANAYHGGAISADGRTAFGASGMPNVPLDWDGVQGIGGKAESPAPGPGGASGGGSAKKKKKNGGK